MDKKQVLGLTMIAVALATSALIPGLGLADEFLIPLGAYLIWEGGRKRQKRK